MNKRIRRKRAKQGREKKIRFCDFKHYVVHRPDAPTAWIVERNWNPEERQCNLCWGLGKVIYNYDDDNPMDCVRCKGTGRWTPNTCGGCDGNKFTATGEVCSHCKGAGILPEGSMVMKLNVPEGGGYYGIWGSGSGE